MKASSLSETPYYPISSFNFLVPVALLYTLAANTYCSLLDKEHVVRPLPTPEPREKKRRMLAIVTGSNTGIGYETARTLAVDYGYTVLLACRSRAKAQQAARRIQSATAAGRAVVVQPLDLSSLQSVREFCGALQVFLQNNNKIHLLVNNAGRNTNEPEPTVDGLDVLFQTNFGGHFLLTTELLRRNLLAPRARVVNLSSVMHHFCAHKEHDMHDVSFWKQLAVASEKSPLQDQKYALSKLAALLFTIELNRRYGHEIQAIAVNPGSVNSDIWRDMPRFLIPLFRLVYLTNQQGCHTTVAAAVGDHNAVVYLQPYWIPAWACCNKGVPWPVPEMLGVFQGHRATTPRLSVNHEGAASALWDAWDELTSKS